MLRCTLAGLLVCLLGTSARAQEPSLVTEAQFLEVLGPSHPAVVERGEDLAVARSRLERALTFDNPLVGFLREDPAGPVAQIDWTASWKLPDASRRWSIAARRQGVDAASARLGERLLALRIALRESYADWALAVARAQVLERQADRVSALAERERRRSAHGESSGLAAERLALAASRLRSRAGLAAATADEARGAARAWNPDLPEGATPEVPPLPEPPALEGDPPRLVAAKADLAAARLGRAAAGRFVRSPAITLGWQHQEAAGTSIEGPTFGLTWAVPLFDRDRGERAAAEARVTSARARVELAERELTAARTAAEAVYRRLRESVGDTRRSLAGSARMLDGAEAAFRHGEADLTDLLETHRSVTDSELTLLDLERVALAAHRELERLAGPARPVPPTSAAIPTTVPEHSR